MPSICIVTDSTVQYSQMNAAARRFVHQISLPVSYAGRIYANSDELRAANLPASVLAHPHPQLIIPTVEQIRDHLISLSARFDKILCLFHSSQLSPLVSNAQEAVRLLHSGSNYQVIDSCAVSVGLGLLVETAAEIILQGESLPAVEHAVRSQIPHIYTVLCTPGASYLHKNQFIDQGQGFVTEMIGLYPIFTLEEGKLTPMEKVKSVRHAENYFLEFLDEYDQLKHVAVLQTAAPASPEIHAIKEHAHEMFPKTPFTTHSINLSTAAIFGPCTFGLFVAEKPLGASRFS